MLLDPGLKEKRRLRELTNEELHRRMRELRVFISHVNKVKSGAEGRLGSLQREIDARSREPRDVENERQSTDHAILRFLERYHGLDIGAVERELKDRMAQAEEIGPHILEHDNLVYMVRPDGLCKTILHRHFIDDEEDFKRLSAQNIAENHKFDKREKPRRLSQGERVSWECNKGHVVKDRGDFYECRSFTDGTMHEVVTPREGWPDTV